MTWLTAILGVLEFLGKLIGIGSAASKESEAEALKERANSVEESYKLENDMKDKQREIEKENSNKNVDEIVAALNEGQGGEEK